MPITVSRGAGNSLFLDTSYVIALAVKNDEYRPAALQIANQLASRRPHVVTTEAVCLEIGSGLARRATRAFAVDFLSRLADDPATTVLPVPPALYARAFALYRSRPDKEWGLTDCMSFVIMSDYGLTEALTADQRFMQAGFRALLREGWA